MNQESLNNFLDTEISLSRLELCVVELPQKAVFKSAIGERRTRIALIIKWIDKEGAVGYGECSCRPDPFYSHEFVEGAIAVVKNYIFPLITEIKNYGQLLVLLNKIRGWNFTKAAVEFAANDLIRRKSGSGILEASGISPIDKVPVGISLGLFDSAIKMRSTLKEVAPLEYKRLKFKITSGYNDPELLKALAELEFDNVSFDANGAFDQHGFKDLSRFAELDRIIEQPYPPTHIYLHQEYLQSYKDFRICLDEEVESFGDLVGHGAEMQQLNIKPGRVGGLWNTLQMIGYCHDYGIDAWIGGMFETSIGRALNLQVASLLPNAKAHDLSPSSRYFTRDLVEHPIEMTSGLISKTEFERIDIDEKSLEDLAIEMIILKI